MSSASDRKHGLAIRLGRRPGPEGVWRRLWHDRRGAVLVEFAILAPVLLLILVGIFIFGLALNQYTTLWNAAAASALQFAISGGGADSTPATNAWNALIYAAPTLTTGSSCSNGVCLTLYVNGNACVTDLNSLSAAEAADTAGDCALSKYSGPATAVATYPCTLQVLQINFYPNCQLTAQVTQQVP
jgi:Flp pilus assembly protein TadG